MKISILIVEDEPAIVDAIQYALEEEGLSAFRGFVHSQFEANNGRHNEQR